MLTYEDLEERLGALNAPRFFYKNQPYTGKTTNRAEAEQKIVEFHFEDGYIQKQIGWDFDGNLFRKFEYKNGVPHGKLIDYYSNGQEYFRAHYVDGVAHGMEYGWYRDGSKRLEVKYVGGVPIYKLEYPKKD